MSLLFAYKNNRSSNRRGSRKDAVSSDLYFQILAEGLPPPDLEYRFDQPVNGNKPRQWRMDMAWPGHGQWFVEIQGGEWGTPVICNHCGRPVTRTIRVGRGTAKQQKVVPVREGMHHTRGQGVQDDYEKWATAHLQGWRVIPVTPAMVRDGRALAAVRAALTGQQHIDHLVW